MSAVKGSPPDRPLDSQRIAPNQGGTDRATCIAAGPNRPHRTARSAQAADSHLQSESHQPTLESEAPLNQSLRLNHGRLGYKWSTT